MEKSRSRQTGSGFFMQDAGLQAQEDQQNDREDSMNWSKIVATALLVLALPAVSISASRKVHSFSFSGFGGPSMLLGPSDIKEYFDPRFGFGGMLRYRLTEKTGMEIEYTRIPFRLDKKRFEKELRGAVNLSELEVLGFHASSLNLGLEGGGVTDNFFSIGLVRYLTGPESRTGVYFTAGGGYCLLDFNDLTVDGNIRGSLADSSTGTTVPVDESIGRITYSSDEMKKTTGMENRWGLDAGLGFEYRIWKNLTVFTEGKYHCVFNSIKAIPANASNGSGQPEKTGGNIRWITVFGGIRAGL